jgi:hypothetical protein
MMEKLLFLLLFTLLTAANGQKVIHVNLASQKIYLKENGSVKFVSNISSGRKGYRTPLGTFRVLVKDKYHRSSKYPAPHGGARMPYTLKITKSGIAIHQGRVPGYPTSHGCIHVSNLTAKKLWRWASVGTKVVVSSKGTYSIKKQKRVQKLVKKRVNKKSKKYVKKHHIANVKKSKKRQHYALAKHIKKRIKKRQVRKKRYYAKKSTKHKKRAKFHKVKRYAKQKSLHKHKKRKRYVKHKRYRKQHRYTKSKTLRKHKKRKRYTKNSKKSNIIELYD